VPQSFDVTTSRFGVDILLTKSNHKSLKKLATAVPATEPVTMFLTDCV
jgi:hypothetical protein